MKREEQATYERTTSGPAGRKLAGLPVKKVLLAERQPALDTFVRESSFLHGHTKSAVGPGRLCRSKSLPAGPVTLTKRRRSSIDPAKHTALFFFVGFFQRGGTFTPTPSDFF